MSYKEQIMSKDKYPSIFSPLMETIVFIILQVFFAKRAVLKTGEYSRIFPSFSWGIWSRDVLRPIERERKYLMDYYGKYIPILCNHAALLIVVYILCSRTSRTDKISADYKINLCLVVLTKKCRSVWS